MTLKEEVHFLKCTQELSGRGLLWKYNFKEILRELIFPGKTPLFLVKQWKLHAGDCSGAGMNGGAIRDVRGSVHEVLSPKPLSQPPTMNLRWGRGSAGSQGIPHCPELHNR